MKVRTLIRLSLTAAALVFATGAFAEPLCGSSSVGKASDEPIRLGGIAGKIGPTDFSAAPRGAAAYFACVNDHGGIAGRPIDYIAEDDQWSPEVSRREATGLISDKKVLAFVGGFSLVGCAAYGDLLKEAGVVSVGMSAQRECFTNPNILSVNGGPRRGLVALARDAKNELGAKSIALSLMRVPGYDWVASGAAEWGKANGVKVISVPFDPQTADPTSFVPQLAQTKADAVLFAMPKNLAVAVLNAAEQQDLARTMKFIGDTASYSPEIPEALGPYWAGRFPVALELGPTEAENADTKAWKAVMDKYADPSVPRDTFSQAGYLSAKIVTAALRKLDPKSIDRSSLARELLQTSGAADQMLCMPFTVRDPKAAGHADVRGFWFLVNTGKEWKVAQACKETLFVDEH